MQVHRHLDQLPAFRNTVITIGTFDGVHNGHKEIVRFIQEAASRLEGESVIITFHPHPRQIIQPESAMFCLNTLQEKLDLLEGLGVHHVVVVPFSRAFSDMDARDYVEQFLFNRFKPAMVVIGYDHRYGRDRLGDIHLLRQLATERGVQVHEISERQEADVAISSTRIRQALVAGDMTLANTLLGYRYPFSGLVVKGDGIGRKLGYATANLQPEDMQKLIPGHGIYAVRAKIYGEQIWHKGLMSIGKRPTFNGQDTRIEVHLLDFNELIYGRRLWVEVCTYLRAEQKFAGEAALIEAMHRDEAEGRAWFDLNGL